MQLKTGEKTLQSSAKKYVIHQDPIIIDNSIQTLSIMRGNIKEKNESKHIFKMQGHEHVFMQITPKQ